jgi:hypothetical protein
VRQAVVGATPPAKAKAKSKKPIALAKTTTSGASIKWKSQTPTVCKIKKGKLVMTGKRGKCKIIGTAPAVGNAAAFSQTYAVRVK